MKDICHQKYSLNRKERSHDIENHCDYLIILDLARSPFVNTVLRQNQILCQVLAFGLKSESIFSLKLVGFLQKS